MLYKNGCSQPPVDTEDYDFAKNQTASFIFIMKAMSFSFLPSSNSFYLTISKKFFKWLSNKLTNSDNDTDLIVQVLSQ